MSKKENDKRIKMAKDWVEVYHREKYKTAIIGLEIPNTYQIVTRVNYITACFWLQWRNEKVNDGRKGFVLLPDKPNWLVMVRNFRRDQERKIKILDYLEERKRRVKAVPTVQIELPSDEKITH